MPDVLSPTETDTGAEGNLVEEPKRNKEKVDWRFTMPSKTYVKDQNTNVHEALALKSIGEAVSKAG